MDVIATRKGFYGGRLRRRGDVFTIASEQDLGLWMADLTTEAAQALLADTKDAPPERGPVWRKSRLEFTYGNQRTVEDEYDRGPEND